MKKVFFAIRKAKSDEKLSGVGYLSEGDLLIPALSSKGKPYIRVFEDVAEKCLLIPDKENEYKGQITVIFTDVPVYVPKTDDYDTIDYWETTYYVWYKFAI